MILLLDNYDSFTYNIVQYLQQLGADVVVIKNDTHSLHDIRMLRPNAIVLGPGPGSPDEAGVTLECVEYYADKLPMLGVCLGHQAIAQVFGASIIRASNVMHGRTSEVFHDQQGLFKGLSNPAQFTRYHSLIVDNNSVPNELIVSGWAFSDTISTGHRCDSTSGDLTHSHLTNSHLTNSGLINSKFAHTFTNSDYRINAFQQSISERCSLASSHVEIMALRHQNYPIESVQFHPESILSTNGMQLLNNFLKNNNLK